MEFKEQLRDFEIHDHFSAFHISVGKKLTLLLLKTCKIDLSHMDVTNPHYFKLNDDSTPFMAFYDFTYDNQKKGQALIKLKDASHNDILEVYFMFLVRDNHPILPAGAHIVKIDVNDDLEYQSACFENRFHFGWSTTFNKPLTKATVLIKRNIDAELKTSTTFEYFTTGHQHQHFLFNKDDLPSTFSSNDNKFYAPLMKIFLHCEQNHLAFHTLFPEYPPHLSLSTSVEGFKSLLELYHTDYHTNLSLINDRLLLLDMLDI